LYKEKRERRKEESLEKKKKGVGVKKAEISKESGQGEVG